MICDGMSEDEDGLCWEVLVYVGSCWFLGIIYVFGVYGMLCYVEVV